MTQWNGALLKTANLWMTIISALMMTVGIPIQAASKGELKIGGAYQVSWSGVEIGALSTSMTQQDERYRIDFAANTAGPLSWFVDFSSQGYSEGKFNNERAMPSVFSVESRRTDKRTGWQIAFDDQGKVKSIDIPKEELEGREPVPDSLKQGPDPLGLLLSAMIGAGSGTSLTGTSFDGKRAIEATLNCNTADLEERFILPDGDRKSDMLVCEIDGEVLAGRSIEHKDKQLQEDDDPPARVWLSPDILDGYHWPVQIEAETRFGKVTTRLVSLSPTQTATN